MRFYFSNYPPEFWTKYNITEKQRDKIEEFMEKYHEEDKKMTLDLIERTELMLLNNS